MTRYALVAGNDITLERIANYLPGNYRVLGMRDDSALPLHIRTIGPHVLICGEDDSGWTMDDYVLPRLASGLWFGTEISKEQAGC